MYCAYATLRWSARALTAALIAAASIAYGQPVISVTGATTFPSTGVNGRSLVQTITIQNTGTSALTVSSMSLDNPTEFGFSYFGDRRPLAQGSYAWCGLGSDASGAPNAGSFVIPSGSSCGMTIYFKPSGVGPRTGVLTLLSDATPPTQTITLSGVGVTGNPPTVPGTPTVTAYNGYATVSFAASSSPDGVVGYTVVSSPADGFDSNAGSSDLAHVVTGLKNGTAYTFTVVADNGVGTSTSPASTAATPQTPSATLPKPVAQENLLAYYPLAGNATDAMGGGSFSVGSSTFSGGSLSVTSGGGQASPLQGVGYKAYSFSVDFNMGASFAGGPVVVLGPSFRSLEFGVDSTMHPRIQWNNHGASYFNEVNETVFTGTTLSKSTWYRATVVVEVGKPTSSSISLYINGALVGAVQSELRSNFLFDVYYSDANASDRVFLFSNPSNGGAFVGYANNLLIYGNSLNAGEVSALNSALGPMGTLTNLLVTSPAAAPVLSFPDTAAGTASAKQTVTISNPNIVAVPISVSVAGTDFRSYPPTCGSSIPALGTCSVDVDFVPPAGTPTSFPSTLNITSSVNSLPVSLDGLSSSLQVFDNVSGALVFTPAIAAGTSSILSITFSNIGAGTSNVDSVVTAGTNAADFAIQSETCTALRPFSPDSNCVVNVRFSPTSVGTKSALARLVFANTTIDVTLTGTAIAGLSAAPSPVNFGSVAAGSSSPAQTVTITKDPSVGCIDWDPPTITGTNAANFSIGANTCTGSFTNLQSTCTIDVQFNASGGAAPNAASLGLSGTFGAGCNALLVALAPQEGSLKSSLVRKGSPIYTVAVALNGTVTSTGVAPSISSVTPSSGTIGVAYNFGFAATGTTPITWSLVTGSLPPGLTLNSSTGAVTGTPTATGSFSFTIRAANAAGQANLSTAISVASPIVSIMSMSTNTLAFGNQNVEVASAPQIVTITNTGTGPFSILSFSGIGDFGYTSNCPLAPSLLQANASCNLNVTFKPLAAGARSGLISVNNNAAQQGTAGNSISLSGNGVAVPRANIIVNPVSLSFGDQAVGSSSDPRVVFVSNTGQAVMELQSVVASGVGFTTGTPSAADNPRGHPLCVSGIRVAPGASCAMSVAFSPVTTGAATGQIVITHNATPSGATGTTNINLTGNGTPRREPLIRVSGTITFNDQILGTASEAQAAFITNIGTATLTVTGLTMTPGANTSATDFTLSGSCGALAPNASCSIGVSFTPTGQKGDKAASLIVSSDAANSGATTSTIPLQGKAIPAPAPIVRLTATTLGFGNVIYGSTPANQQVTLTNVGDLALTVIGIGVTGNSDFTQTNTCGTKVEPQGSCAINVWFAPHAIGARAATLTLRSNADPATNSLPLTGTGCRYFSPAAARFFLTSC